MTVIDYETIEDVLLPWWESGLSSLGGSQIPWVNSPKINAQTSVYNIPEWEPTTPDLVWWTTDIVWSASDYDTVAWTSWTIKLADWTSYSVNSWNTWNMAAITYIYYDWTTTLKTTTTPQTAVWAGKIMVCVAKNETSPKKATFQAFGTLWQWILITADNIAANTITANEIASNTITATQISASYVYAWDINASQITAWTITWRTLQTGTSWQRVVIDASNNRIQFYDSSWNDCWYIRWVASGLIWDVMEFSSPLRVAWWAGFSWGLLPRSDASYDLWTSSYQWNNIYVKENINIDWYVLDESIWYLRWRWNYVPYITWSSTNKTTNASIKIMINGSEYYVNVLAV